MYSEFRNNFYHMGRNLLGSKLFFNICIIKLFCLNLEICNHDYWCWLCGDQPLKVTFLVLYENALDWEASMESLLVRQNVGKRSWVVRFLWDFNDC